jgi:hypothetical protein
MTELKAVIVIEVVTDFLRGTAAIIPSTVYAYLAEVSGIEARAAARTRLIRIAHMVAPRCPPTAR